MAEELAMTADPASYVFRHHEKGEEFWRAVWGGELARAEFNSKGAALAYIDSCDHVGRLRA